MCNPLEPHLPGKDESLADQLEASGDLVSLPAPEDNRANCPICGYSPCAEDCRLGLHEWEVNELEAMFWEPDEGDDDDGQLDGGEAGCP